MRSYILLAPIAAILLTACGDGNADSGTNTSQEVNNPTTIATTAAAATTTTVEATTTTVADVWSRDTLVAMEPCLSSLRLLAAGDVDPFTVEDAWDSCDPAKDQVKVDADISGTVAALDVNLAFSFLMLQLATYRVDQSNGDAVPGSVQSFLDAWEAAS